jgi:hypothetical protein
MPHKSVAANSSPRRLIPALPNPEWRIEIQADAFIPE